MCSLEFNLPPFSFLAGLLEALSALFYPAGASQREVLDLAVFWLSPNLESAGKGRGRVA